MNKYIPTEKLIAEIERRKEFYHERGCGCDNAIEEELDDLLVFIASLRQEQPKLPGYNKALLEVKSKVNELYEETSIGLSEYDSGLYNGIAETCMKLRGFIKARLESDEQPEVDLKGEFHRWLSYELGLNARKED